MGFIESICDVDVTRVEDAGESSVSGSAGGSSFLKGILSDIGSDILGSLTGIKSEDIGKLWDMLKRPFTDADIRSIAKRYGLSENEVRQALDRYKRDGVIPKFYVEEFARYLLAELNRMQSAVEVYRRNKASIVKYTEGISSKANSEALRGALTAAGLRDKGTIDTLLTGIETEEDVAGSAVSSDVDYGASEMMQFYEDYHVSSAALDVMGYGRVSLPVGVYIMSSVESSVEGLAFDYTIEAAVDWGLYKKLLTTDWSSWERLSEDKRASAYEKAAGEFNDLIGTLYNKELTDQYGGKSFIGLVKRNEVSGDIEVSFGYVPVGSYSDIFVLNVSRSDGTFALSVLRAYKAAVRSV